MCCPQPQISINPGSKLLGSSLFSGLKTTKKAMFYTRQRIFEYGDKNGRLLARLAKTQNPMTYIVSVRGVDGSPLVSPESINNRFLEFFKELSQSRITYSLTDLTTFLDSIAHPTLATADRERLESDIPPGRGSGRYRKTTGWEDAWLRGPPDRILFQLC